MQFTLCKNRALEVYGVFAVYHLSFSSKQFQACNKSLINQACSRPYWEKIGPWADILPVRPSCLVNKIYISIRLIVKYIIRIRLDLVKHLMIKISEISFTQRFDDSMHVIILK